MKRATIVVDLGFGDSGKGTIVDFLPRAREVAAVIRFSGGGQAAHNVIDPNGRHHTFSMFGSATLNAVRTHLSRFVLVDPTVILNESRHLESIGVGNPFSLLSIDEDSLVVTPFHKAANRLRETLRDKNRHGSCGMGIGETTADNLKFPELSLRVRDLRNQNLLLRKLRKIQEFKLQEFLSSLPNLRTNTEVKREINLLTDPNISELVSEEYIGVAKKLSIVSGDYLSVLANQGELVFEGSQGVLLDEWYGFHPYTTWSTTTFANALELLREINYDGDIERLGVLRSYFTRHGAGPFPTEDAELSRIIPELHNGVGKWQGNFRLGWFDEVLVRYALEVVGGVDSLAITNLDRLETLKENFTCAAYESDGGLLQNLEVKSELTDLSHQEGLTKILAEATPLYRASSTDGSQFIHEIEETFDTPVSIASYGPASNDKKLRWSVA